MAAPLSTSIELRHLRYFVAAAQHGSFRKAGVALEVKESSISRSVRDLEDEIGVSLFIRHSSGVSLTLAGQRFLNRTRQALDQIREATVEAAALGRAEDGHLKVGLFSNLSSGFLRDLFQTYDSRYAGVHIDFVEAPAENRDVLSWRDLVDETFLVRTEGSGNEVRGFLERKFRELDISPRISTQQLARYSLLGLVATGRGIVPVLGSETVIGLPEVVFRPLAGEAIPFSVIYSPRNDYPAVRTLLSITRKMAGEQAATR